MIVATTKLEEIILQQCNTCSYWEFMADNPHPWGYCKWKPCEDWPWYIHFFSKYTDFNHGYSCKAWRKI